MMNYINNSSKMIRCKICNSDNVGIDENDILVCASCGSIQDSLLVPASFSEEVRQTKKQQFYSRLSHFREYLCHLQANERTTIDSDIIKALKKQYPFRPSRKTIRKLLPRKYTRNISKILYLVWNVVPISIAVKDFNRFESMFKQIEQCSRDFGLKHFLQLNYIFYQICELTDKMKYVKSIGKMKNQATVDKYNQMWKEICKRLKWKYHEYEI